MGPAAVDDEARSCLPAASQALSPDCAATPVTGAGSGWPKLWRKLWSNIFFGRQRRDLQFAVDLLQPYHHFSLSSFALPIPLPIFWTILHVQHIAPPQRLLKALLQRSCDRVLY